jgi:sugar lactone lactonase YvrE
MSEAQAELVLDARNGVGESPVWDAAEQALYWVDIPREAVPLERGRRRAANGSRPKCSPA